METPERPESASDTTPWSELLDETIARLTAAGVDEPGREARWIVERAAGDPYLRVADEPVTVRSHHHWRLILERRESGQPLQYALERWAFRHLDLFLDPRVLIPRPETEEVAGAAIDAARTRSDAPVVDLGTGSGAIALSVATEVPGVTVWGTDESPDALAVARANLAGIGRLARHVRLVEGSWYDALPEELAGTVGVIVSNPPYVPDTAELPSEVADHEPPTALFAGPDGLDDIRVVVAGAPRWLAPDGVIVVEHGDDQGEAVRVLAADAGLVDVRTGTDLAGRERYLIARRP